MKITRRQLRRIILNEVGLLNEAKNPAGIRKILKQKGYDGMTALGSNSDADSGVIVMFWRGKQQGRSPAKAADASGVVFTARSSEFVAGLALVEVLRIPARASGAIAQSAQTQPR